MPFDPDKYLSDSGGFDPDAYLGGGSASIFAKGPLKIGKDAFGDTLRDTLKNTDWATRNIAGAGSAVVNAAEGLKGIFGKSDPNEVAAQKVIAEEAPIGNLAGNVAMLAPTALIPGANTVTGAATIGAIQGAALTPGDIAERAKAAVLGFGGGAAGAGLSKLASSAAPVATNQNAATLAREGISLTPGQNAGGFLKSLEDKMTSAPFVGDIIQSARRRGIEDFNRAAFRRVADPLERAGIPVQSGDIGRQGMQALRQDLSAAYDDVLSRSSANALEPQFVQNMASLRQLASALPPREQAAFDAIIEREIGQRMAPNGMVNAENLQAAKSGLGQQVTNFSTANSGHERNLGMALKQADEEFRNLVARANPQNATDLKAIDTAYANFKRLQRAASGVGAEDGIFTPAQLNSAVKAMDKSKDKRAFSEGNALMQDLTDPAKAVMPSKIPDSGTAGRLLSDITNPLRWPGLAANTAAALPVAIAYSRPGAAAINYGMNNGAIPATNALQRLLADNPNLSRLLGTVSPKLVGN
jgi:hypothetical protein